MGGPSGIALPFWFLVFCLHLPTEPPPHGTESHPPPQPPTHPPTHPPVRGSQAAQHSAFHNFCQPLFMYSCVRTLGLVCSFWVCAFNILLNEFFFFVELILSHIFVLFLLFFSPNKIIAIAAVQPASHVFLVWLPVAQIKVVATFLLSVWQKKKTTL